MDSFSEIWSAACDYMKEALNVSDVAFNLWISPLVPESFDGQTAKFTCPTSYKIQIITTRYDGVIKEALTAVMGFDDIEVIYLFKPQETDDEKEQSEEKNHLSSRDSTSTFENFIVGSTNKFAYATALNAAEHPGEEYNPLFIYGKSGLGKTHLLKAIKNRMLEKNPSANVLYTTSENFTNDLIYYLGKKNMGEFHDKYRNVDALLIDDIQFIANKKSTEEEFFHTFNELFNSKKQIVLTSDRLPNELKTLEDRLRTRFGQGLTIDVSVPNFETRVAILQQKALEHNKEIDEDALLYVAEHIRSSVRELEGALLKIISMSEFKKCKITKDFAEEVLKKLIPKSETVTPQNIIKKVSTYYNISESDITGKVKTKEIVVPRQISMYLCRKILNMNDTNIGKEFGKDRTTVGHNIEKIEESIDTNSTIKSDVNYILKDLNYNEG